MARIGTGALCYVPSGLGGIYILYAVIMGSQVHGCRAVAGTMAGDTSHALAFMGGMVTGCRRDRMTAAAGRGWCGYRRRSDCCQGSSNGGDLHGSKSR